MDKTLIERLDRAFDDSNYFFAVLQVLFYKDNKWSRRVTELDRDMFRDFCDHVQTTYQNLFIGTDDPRAYMQFVTPYIVLLKIALFPEYIDSKHERLQGFAELVCSSISNIMSPTSTENRLIISDDPFFNACGEWTLYDFEKDTPEDVWDRLSGYAETVIALWNQKSTGHSEYLTDEAGHTLDHIPLTIFLKGGNTMTIFEEILNLLSGSPELHTYLLEHPEKLRATDYADIITGAPIALTEKGRLLERLSGHIASNKDAGLIQEYIACLNKALQALESKEAVFSVELWKDGERLSGLQIALSVDELRRAIPEYWKHWADRISGEPIAYWRIEQYRQGSASDDYGFARPEYTFAAAPNGEVQYFMHDSHKRAGEWAGDAFCGDANHLNLPVPYRPGDILEFSYAPYISEPHYCILTEAGNDGLQCLHRCVCEGDRCCDGWIDFGTLTSGRFLFNYHYDARYISPLYGIRVYAGKLPRECEFMERLSEKLHKEPEFAKTLRQVWNYMDFCLPDE